MLCLLNITDFVLVDSASIPFSAGFNVLTGETGAGKSVIVRALEAVLGARLGADVVRQGADAARVEALFELSPSGGEAIVDQLALAGLEVEPEEALIIRREISSNGRSRVFINDVLSTVGLLRSLQPHLAMVQSQGAQLSLLEPGMQLDFLDTFLQLEQLRSPLKVVYSAYLEASSSLRQFDIRTSESAK